LLHRLRQEKKETQKQGQTRVGAYKGQQTWTPKAFGCLFKSLSLILCNRRNLRIVCRSETLAFRNRQEYTGKKNNGLWTLDFGLWTLVLGLWALVT
jgi:hypothetical protein